MIAIGNDELNNLSPLGKTVKCYVCGKRHRVVYGQRILPDGTKEASKALAFFRCKGKTYLCGINGKELRP